jgi:hypothetical protein
MADNRGTCAIKSPSSCIDYTGGNLLSINNDNIPCDPNINDIFSELDGVIKSLKDSLDLTNLNKECLNFDSTSIKSNELFQLIINKLCGIDASLIAVKEIVNSLKIEDVKLTVDLKCLSGNSCTSEVSNDISTILSIIISEICSMKTQINNLIGKTTGSSIYIPV